MAGVVGRGNKSYIKQPIHGSSLPDFGINILKWAHVEATGGFGITIDFNNLVLPVAHELRQAGFANPAVSRITALDIPGHRNNLRVTSNLNGVLLDYVTYNVEGETIVFVSTYDVEVGEYFIFEFDQNVETGNKIVNARPLRKTEILPAARTRMALGTSIEIATSIVNSSGIDSQQIGNIQVYAEGRILFRNPGNAVGTAATSGNYREVFLDNVTTAGIEAATVIDNGTANAIEFNEALAQDADMMIISTNLIVDSEANTISTLTNEAANKLNEFPALELTNAEQFLRVNAGGTAYELTGSTGGHIIEDDSGSPTEFPLRASLQFTGATITDDVANDRTIVETSSSIITLSQTGGDNSAGDGDSAGSQSSFHWIAPTGVTSVKVYMTSAGGTGGVGPNPTARPGGGAGGGTIITTLQVVAGQRYELLIADDNPGISDAGGSGRGGRNGGATVFRSPSGSTTALINGKNRAVVCIGGNGGGRNGAGTASSGGGLSASTNTGTINAVSDIVNFQVEVDAIGGQGAAANVSPGNNSPGGGSFYEPGGPLRQHDGNERGSGGAGFLGFPGGESMGGSGSAGRGGIFIEYIGPTSTIDAGLTP